MADDVSQRASRLSRLWSELAMRHVALGSSCGCGAGGVSLQLVDFELDIVDYLEDQGLRSGVAEVEKFFRARPTSEATGLPLQTLLEDLERDEFAAEASEWLLARLERTLNSFAELHGGRQQGGS
ncbi:hypothetical protein QTH89_25755 [Variovorax sp. J22G21]|uniref:hypothetical protein n=1 Tax=Variovorax fucosicus TaxID=3053517 RepID=UPI0025750AEC|nr:MULTISPECIES: hypothetical protein [unclassified Variovorax]MDM0039806.1 hypothetical protein [Variovorax sp. J22R193]MDM0064645.1 hypothetical protein [Variovorax sp. J22G21]